MKKANLKVIAYLVNGEKVITGCDSLAYARHELEEVRKDCGAVSVALITPQTSSGRSMCHNTKVCAYFPMASSMYFLKPSYMGLRSRIKNEGNMIVLGKKYSVHFSIKVTW